MVILQIMDMTSKINNKFFSKILNWINKEFLLENERKVLLREIEGAGFDIESVESIKRITFGHNILGIRKKKKDLQLRKKL